MYDAGVRVLATNRHVGKDVYWLGQVDLACWHAQCGEVRVTCWVGRASLARWLAGDGPLRQELVVRDATPGRQAGRRIQTGTAVARSAKSTRRVKEKNREPRQREQATRREAGAEKWLRDASLA